MKIIVTLLSTVFAVNISLSVKAQEQERDRFYSSFIKPSQSVGIVRSMNELERQRYSLDADLSASQQPNSLLNSGTYIHHAYNRSHITTVEYDKENGYFSSKTHIYQSPLKKKKIGERHISGIVFQQGNTLTFTHISNGAELLPFNKTLIIDAVDNHLSIKDLVGHNMTTYTKVLDLVPLE
ncbi:hypothetical protein [Photobacterium leiognathi]|uniref:hypothetical protein n=1 Tax=Photobacterium leiognathi TaxID=553611 RepID=UPI002738B77B|nr:hypothetical protein [Photobacterium leiognathi]